MKKTFFILIYISFFLNVFCQENTAISHNRYHQFQGDFVFEDGSYITGGPMGEIKQSVVYLEPENGKFGGAFVPKNKTVFSSAFPPESKTKIEFKLDDKGEVAGLWWLNEKEDKRYATKEIAPIVKQVSFNNGNITLAGELIFPEGNGPFPAVINVHGSGRQDRHLGPWTSFFTRYGIVVLSYDKRGVGASTGRFETAGYEDLASDVLSGIEFLKKHPAIDSSLIGIQGSSEGGWVGSIAASKQMISRFS